MPAARRRRSSRPSMPGWPARRSGPRFVGSHPLAGDHRTGPEHARADLFEGRTVVVTPTEHTRPAAVTEVSGFWQSLGANVAQMTPAEHDAALAVTSHLPHLVAVALAAATPTELLPLTASGWRDTTRVAGGDPESVAGDFRRQPAACARCARSLGTNMLTTLRESFGTRRQREPDLDSGNGRKKETGPRCSGRLTFIRPRASRTAPAERVAAAARELGLADGSAASPRPAAIWSKGQSLDRAARRAAGERAAGRRGRRTGRDWRVGDAQLSKRDRAIGESSEQFCCHRAAQAGRDGPGGPERAGGGRRFGRSAGGVRDAAQVLARRRRATARSNRSASGCWPTTPSSRCMSARCRSSSWSWAGRIDSNCGHVPIRELDDDALDAAEPRGAALSATGRDADDPAAFPRLWAASRPTSNWRRSPRPGASIAATRRSPAGSLIATRTASGSSRTC